MDYPHLHLTDWPFRVTPDEAFSSFMADRTQFQQDIETMLQHLSRQPASSIHLMWAWFGAGKTHSLFHIEHLCRNKHTSILPVYMEFPRGGKGFIDVYRTFIGSLSTESLDEAYVRVFADESKQVLQRQLREYDDDVANAVSMHYSGNREQQETCRRWLKCEQLEMRRLRELGIMRQLKTADDAAKAMIWIIRLIGNSATYLELPRRVLLMIDEYQRIENLRQPSIASINECLHSVFNACPNGLSIVISFSGFPEEKKLPVWLSPELKDRMDRKAILLPRLTSDEAVSFVRDLLQHFRSPTSNHVGAFFPFEESAVRGVIARVQESHKNATNAEEPKPRTIMQVFRTILQEAEPAILDKRMGSINMGTFQI